MSFFPEPQPHSGAPFWSPILYSIIGQKSQMQEKNGVFSKKVRGKRRKSGTEAKMRGKRKSGTGRYGKEGDEPGGKANRGKETARTRDGKKV